MIAHHLPTRWCLIFCLTPISVFGALNSKTSLTVDFRKPDDSKAVFETSANNSKIVTNAAFLEFRATASSEDTRFLLMNYNSRDFPIYEQDGEFSATLELTPGYNQLKLASLEDQNRTLDRQIIRITPARIESVGNTFASDASSEAENLLTDLTQSIVTSAPSIQISGKRGQPEELQIQARDQYGNPLVVESQDDTFSISYTLTEGHNSIVIRSVFEDRTIDVQTLQFELKDPISLNDLTEVSSGSMIRKGQLPTEYISQSLEIPVNGTVQAFADGTIELSVDGITEKVPVKEHHFSASVKLNPSATTNLKVSFVSENQSYFDHAEINYAAPSIMLNSIISGQYHNGSIQYHQPFQNDQSNRFSVKTPFIQLTGVTSFFGNALVSIQNLATGQVANINDGSDTFSAEMMLAEGENILECSIRCGDETLTTQRAIIDYQNTTFIHLKGLDRNNEDRYLTTHPLIALEGVIESVADGRAKVQLNEQQFSAPIQKSLIDFELPNPLLPGINQLNASIMLDGINYAKSFIIEYQVPESQEPENIPIPSAKTETPTTPGPAAADSVSGGDNSISPTQPIRSSESIAPKEVSSTPPKPEEKPTAADEFTPPKPVRTPAPDNVKNPNNRRENITGTCVFEFVIGTDGTVSKDGISVIDTSNELLNEAGIEALSKWKFRPALLNGEPVEKRTRIKLSWN